MFGAHLSVAGGMHHAPLEARDLGMTCVQVFTKNQRQWKAPPLRDEAVATWHDTLAETGIAPDAVVSHDSYLINLASPDKATRRKSIDLFIDEVRRCDALSIPHLVAHPGAHLGTKDDPADEAAGIARIADALNEVHDTLPDSKTITCLETTAGQGTTLGHHHHHLGDIIDAVAAPQRVAVCIDTAHLFAAGHPLTSAAGARKTLNDLEAVCGKGCVRVVHVNDSLVPHASRKDRHAHIGHGHIPTDALAAVLRRRNLQRVPKVLETAKGDAPDGRTWDAVNLEAMQTLANKTNP
ncbi:MAG: deoxyribonuclease IV [Planctomycetota bacterium]